MLTGSFPSRYGNTSSNVLLVHKIQDLYFRLERKIDADIVPEASRGV